MADRLLVRRESCFGLVAAVSSVTLNENRSRLISLLSFVARAAFVGPSSNDCRCRFSSTPPIPPRLSLRCDANPTADRAPARPCSITCGRHGESFWRLGVHQKGFKWPSFSHQNQFQPTQIYRVQLEAVNRSVTCKHKGIREFSEIFGKTRVKARTLQGVTGSNPDSPPKGRSRNRSRTGQKKSLLRILRSDFWFLRLRCPFGDAFLELWV